MISKSKVRKYGCLVLAILLLLYLVCAIYAGGARIYFSPQTLQYKVQDEICLLGTDIPLYRSLGSYGTYEIVDVLVEYGYWQPISAHTVEDWILINHWNYQWNDGHNDFVKLLLWRQENWINWTDRNPELARLFWGKIQELMRTRFNSIELVVMLSEGADMRTEVDWTQLMNKIDSL